MKMDDVCDGRRMSRPDLIMTRFAVCGSEKGANTSQFQPPFKGYSRSLHTPFRGFGGPVFYRSHVKQFGWLVEAPRLHSRGLRVMLRLHTCSLSVLCSPTTTFLRQREVVNCRLPHQINSAAAAAAYVCRYHRWTQQESEDTQPRRGEG